MHRCRGNPQYSLRAFARSLGVDCGSLSKILNGQRPLGLRATTRLGERLGLSPSELQPYVDRFKSRRGQDAGEPETSYATIDLDRFRIIADWHHLAILELARTKAFSSDPAWIAKRLGLTKSAATVAVKRLIQTGLLTVDQNGAWNVSGPTTTTRHAFTDIALKKFQAQVLTKAIEAMNNTSFERRSQSTVTMAVDSARLTEARALIASFRDGMAQLLSREGPCDEVYQLSVSLFPVTATSDSTVR